MYYGEDIIISRKGIRIRPKALHPIGIEDESVCWGIIIPPNPEEVEGKEQQHLVISQFNPKNWLALFRLTIELKSDTGTIAKVTEFLSREGFNIFSTQCALAGYNHATWNIIGESLEVKEAVENELKGIQSLFKADLSAFNDLNDNFRVELTDRITLDMFKYCSGLETRILTDDKKLKEEHLEDESKEDYLYDKLTLYDTLLCKQTQKNEGKLKRHKSRQPQTVRCDWVTQLAIYRIYSEVQKLGVIDPSKNKKRLTYPAAWDTPIRFNYNLKSSFLEPQSVTDKNKYLDIIEKCVDQSEIEENKDFPIRVIGAFNPQEHYMRIIFPHKEIKNKRLFIQVNYKTDLSLEAENVKELDKLIEKIDEKLKEETLTESNYKPLKDEKEALKRKKNEGISSIGILQNITQNLSAKKISIDYVSNSIHNYSENTETGRISFIITPKETSKKLIEEIKSDLKEIDEEKKKYRFRDSDGKLSNCKNNFLINKIRVFG